MLTTNYSVTSLLPSESCNPKYIGQKATTNYMHPFVPFSSYAGKKNDDDFNHQNLLGIFCFIFAYIHQSSRTVSRPITSQRDDKESKTRLYMRYLILENNARLTVFLMEQIGDDFIRQTTEMYNYAICCISPFYNEKQWPLHNVNMYTGLPGPLYID